MTLLEVLQSTTAYFKKRKIESARLNAEHLLAHTLRRKRLELYLEFERPLQEAELAPLREFVRRRGEGEPLQHLLGTVEFCGLEFLCDKRAMVPRPETEQLVESLIADCGLRTADCHILDVGAGSGVIALTLASSLPEAKVWAVDISEEALALAEENAIRLGLSERVQFSKSDLLGNLTERFDLVVANLPYISMRDRKSLSREVLHDPEVALFGGERGDELIGTLIEQAPARLRPNGLLALEIGVGQSDALLGMLKEKKFHDIEAKNDYSGTLRFLFARYG
ncbi:MAG: release factor glutamine methyltransferase [Verrucomicrobiota bacterium]|jgi:release factor glutamine methyltransferase